MGEVESEDADAPQSEGELRSLVIDADQHGERLDRALVLCVPEFSRPTCSSFWLQVPRV